MRQGDFPEADNQRIARQNLEPTVSNAGRCDRSCAALETGRSVRLHIQVLRRKAACGKALHRGLTWTQALNQFSAHELFPLEFHSHLRRMN